MDDVRACAWWWSRSPGAAPHVMQLDVDDAGSEPIVVHAEAGGGQFFPADWGGDGAEWAPCTPLQCNITSRTYKCVQICSCILRSQ